MTLGEFVEAVHALAGERGSSAGLDVRRHLLSGGVSDPETRWTAYVETMPASPGVVVDEASPELAIERLRARLRNGGREEPVSASAPTADERDSRAFTTGAKLQTAPSAPTLAEAAP